MPSDNSIREQVEAALADVPFRDPIVDHYNPEVHDNRHGIPNNEWFNRIDQEKKKNDAFDSKTDHQWQVITEAARRSITTDPNIRQAMTEMVTEPLSETLPRQAVDVLASNNDRITRIYRLAGGNLGKVLGYEPVPDELIKPDIRHTPTHKRKNDEIDRVVRWELQVPGSMDAHLEEVRAMVKAHPGITNAEKDLIARRYRYAREVKLLGLMAELYDHPVGELEAQDGLVSYELPSGVKMVMDAEAYQDNPSFLDPNKWQSRKQIKDRVYEVKIDGQSYVLKEKKTPKHTDVKRHGHQEGLNSRQEFETARQFAALGVIEQGDVNLRWEKPLGYVEFPDGFQFCMFEFEEDLEAQPPTFEIMWAIEDSREQYEEEFQQISQRAKEIFETRKDLVEDGRPKPKRVAVSPRSRRYKRQYQASHQEDHDSDELTFKEFARLKAEHLGYEAEELLSRTITEAGIVNSDRDGFAFKLKKGDRPTLDMVGFDFEYYLPSPEGAKRLQENWRTARESGEITRSYAATTYDNRPIAVAASYAMLKDRGYALPVTRKDE